MIKKLTIFIALLGISLAQKNDEFKGLTDEEISQKLDQKCTAGCEKETNKQKLRTFDADMNFYRKCLRDNCGVGNGGLLPTQDSIDKTEESCIFVCHKVSKETTKGGHYDQTQFDVIYNKCLRDKCHIIKNAASKSYFKLVSLAKEQAYCNNYKALGASKDLKTCLNQVQRQSSDACISGGGYFAYDPSSDGFCACCTSAEDALTDVTQTKSKECKIYKTLEDSLPVYQGCYYDTPNKSTKALADDDPTKQLYQRIAQIGNFDWLRDGLNKNLDLYFEDDLTIYSHLNNGQGKWEIISTNTIKVTFVDFEATLQFNLSDMTATMLTPVRDPPTKMLPSNSYGNDIMTEITKTNEECTNTKDDQNFGNFKTSEECAAVAFNNGCYNFMYASQHTEWGCKCCSDYKETGGLYNEDGWNIYNVKQRNLHPGNLNVLIGYNMKPKNCFDIAHSKGYKYVGLQNGNECYAGNSLATRSEKYGRVSDLRCNYMCDQDKGKTCGGQNVNSVWDIRKYTGYMVKMPLCRTNINKLADCTLYGGYNTADLCMNSCHSATRVTPHDMCQLACIDYRDNDQIAFKTREERTKKCYDQCKQDQDNVPTPIGCFVDKQERDLANWIGTDMTIEQCIKEAQFHNYRYIGLQFGRECWADNALGSYGRVEESQCNMPCSRDNMAHCGAGLRNMIYDTENLMRKSKAESDKAKKMKKCAKEDGKIKHVDCSSRGGYKQSDVCNQTCRSDLDIATQDKMKIDCQLQCDDEANTHMQFKTITDKQAYVDQCTETCQGHEALALYQGCYEDKSVRDLPIRLGGNQNMNPDDCFKEARKTMGINFVGLQYGGECWGGKTFGEYNKLADAECNMICSEQPELSCGGSWRNSIYMLTHYDDKQANAWKHNGDKDKSYEDLVNGNDCPDIPPKDCSQAGGLFQADSCKQTCNDDHKKEECQSKCFEASKYDPTSKTFYSKNTNNFQNGVLNSCLNACTGHSMECPKQFVDCSEQGGYDPKDSCKQTCVVGKGAHDDKSCGLICQFKADNTFFKTKEEFYDFQEDCSYECKNPSEFDQSCPTTYVDCRLFGGYDPEDPCKQTCKNKESEDEIGGCQSKCNMQMSSIKFSTNSDQAKWWDNCQTECESAERGCDNKCRVMISGMRFFTDTEQMQFYYSCQIKCKIETTQVKNSKESCSGKFVDCLRFGGYDPTDPCHETCVESKTDYDREEQAGDDDNKQKNERDTQYSEVTTDTKMIIRHGQRVDVECRGFPILNCYRIGSYISLDWPKKRSIKDIHKNNKPKDGSYWKYDCNWVQKFIYQNCWEGDDGKGHECTIWDRLMFKQCMDLAGTINQPQSLIALISAFTIMYASA